MGGFRYQLVPKSLHVVGATIFADPGNANGSGDLKGASCMFYTTHEPDTPESYEYIATVALKPGENYSFGDEITGAWIDAGLYVVVFGNSGFAGSNNYDDRVAINLTYVERRDYTPAFQDPLELAQHYWACNRTDDLYHNWYSGTQTDDWVDDAADYRPDSDGQLTIPPPPPPPIGGGITADPILTQHGDYLLDENNNYVLSDS